MDPRLYEANGRRQWHALRHNGTDAGGRRADGAEVGMHSFLVDDVAALPILLIIHDERHRGGGCEDSCIAGGREQSLALPKTNVADTKLHSAGRAVPRWERILADSQKKVKGHDYKVCRCGLAGRGVRVITSGRRSVNGVYRERYLGFGCRIAHPEGLKEVGKGQSQVGSCTCSSGSGYPSSTKACAT
jgi:hypothetical protein